MSYLSEISFRRAIGLFATILLVLLTSTWLTARLLTQHLLNDDARETARHWAEFLTANVPDLEQIANGEMPSTTSLAFFNATRKAGAVFRYVIFNKDGNSQLISDHTRVAPVDISEFNAQAARAATTGLAIVDTGSGGGAGWPAYFAEAFVPVMVNGKTAAVVGAYVDETGERDRFYYSTLTASALLCAMTGLAFGIPAIAWYRRTREKQQADRRIRFLAHHDSLTGLANRARLIERLNGALSTLPVTGGMLAVHFIDIDHFKQVNDRHGHPAGDDVLRELAARALRHVRSVDLIGRLGGEEFVVVMPETSLSGAVVVAERLRAAVADEPFRPRDCEAPLRVTISIGVAVTGDGKANSDTLLKRADDALYNAKNGGRNRVVAPSEKRDAA